MEERESDLTSVGDVLGGRKLRAWPPMGEDRAPGIEFRRMPVHGTAAQKLKRTWLLVPIITDLNAFYRNCNTSMSRPYVEGECRCCRGAGFVQGARTGKVMGCPVCHGSGKRAG